MYYNVECIMNGEIYGVVMTKTKTQYRQHRFEISKEETLQIKSDGGDAKHYRSQARRLIEDELKKKFKNFEIVIPRDIGQFSHFKVGRNTKLKNGNWGVVKILAVNGTDDEGNGRLDSTAKD